MEKYNHKIIESKWQKYWEKKKLYKTSENKDKPKFYCLDMFPYPSGAGLHVGHPKGYIATDIFARAKMLQGYNVLHPMGWDAFGLPAENYAIKNKIHPRAATEKNIATFKKQLSLLGFTYDWTREINTTDPEYYKWTQWTFLKMFERGLAYESNEPVNWCPDCKTVLSNEDLEDGKCERCGSVIERKPMRQWLLKITDYAERLLNDLEKLTGWEESIKEMQKNWIGRSEGAIVKFPIPNSQFPIEVYTTRIDTIFSGTYIIFAPEHKFLEENRNKIKNREEVLEYILKSKNISDIERTAEGKDWSGVEVKGVQAMNPATNEKISIWVADFVLGNYGTGAVFADAHDGRDFYLAKKYKIPLKVSIAPNKESIPEISKLERCFEGEGILFNSNQFNGMTSAEARPKIINWLKEKGLAEVKVNYKLRDWVFSRQRYWGEPIPIVHCEYCALTRAKHRKNRNCIILHGCPSKEEDMIDIRRMNAKHWIPWLKSELQNNGIFVETPFMPTPWQPDYQLWKKKLEKLKIGENTVLVGHSCGCTFLLRWLGETNRKIGKLVLVAPQSLIHKGRFPEDWIAFSINEAIKKNVKEILIFTADNEEERRRETAVLIKTKLAARLIELKGKGHFTYDDLGGQACPELLNEIVKDKDFLRENFNPGLVPVPYEDLPLKLPEVKNYEPTGTGESPLANIKDWVNTKCPRCGGRALRETNTMPQWAGSSWYYLRYIDPKNKKALVEKGKEKYWSPVDFYVGGAEHATRHLIYARFWHKFLFDLGAVNYDEPFTRLQHVGLILDEDGRKMSKRWNNVINPDDIVKDYGADAMRVYEMFMGPFSQPCAWSTNGLIGAGRFLERIWNLYHKIKLMDCGGGTEPCKNVPAGMPQLLHKTIKKVTEDIESFHFNTAISQMMIFINFAGKFDIMPRAAAEKFLIILSPFAPHLAEELWQKLGHKKSIFKEVWPKYNPKMVKDEIINLVIQVNGKVRDIVEVDANISEDEAKGLVLENEKVKKWLEGREIKKVIFVKGRLVNLVI